MKQAWQGQHGVGWAQALCLGAVAGTAVLLSTNLESVQRGQDHLAGAMLPQTEAAAQVPIKVLAVDRELSELIDRARPNYGQWLGMVRSAAQSKPKAIVLDATFDTHEMAYHHRALTAVFGNLRRSTGTPITYAAPSADLAVLHSESLQKLRSTLHGIGHNHAAGPGSSLPVMLTTESQRVPHASLLALEAWSLAESGMFHAPDGRQQSFAQLPGDSLVTDSTLSAALLPLSELYKTSIRNQQLTELKDSIVVLTNTTFADAPSHAGLKAHYAALQHSLGGHEAKRLGFSGLATLLFAMLAGFAGWRAGRLGWVAVMAVATAGGITMVIMAQMQIVVGFSLAILAPLAGGSTVLAMVFAKANFRSRLMQSRVGSRHRPNVLTSFNGALKGPVPVSREVTALMINVRGYGLEEHDGHKAVAELKRLHQMLTETIEEHDGFIAKMMDDDILCLFANPWQDEGSKGEYAFGAVQAALEIQREFLSHNSRASEAGRPVYPVRIGIASGQALVGMLDNIEGKGFVLRGAAVRNAKALLDMCEGHHVMISHATQQYWREACSGDHSLQCLFNKRLMKIPGEAAATEAFEYNPFDENPDMYRAAEKAFMTAANIKRASNRMEVPEGMDIRVSCELADGNLVDFSPSGLAIKLDHFIAKGQKLKLKIGTSNPSIHELLDRYGLDELVGEVRWGREIDGQQGYLHGVHFANLSDSQQARFYTALSEALQIRNEAQASA